jgi:4-hydroxy-tetrahydrodipicolinate synthase
MEFRGAYTALVTPFKGGEVDEEAYRSHVDWQIEQGIDGLVPCGTTGESATLSHEEHKRVVEICVDQAKGRVPVLAGAGSNNTSEAVLLTRYAKEAGADGALLITPYYNKPTQDGLVAHFKAIAKEVSIPIIVYNVPGRTSLNVLPETMGRLFKEIPDVVGCKEASANLKQISEVYEYCGPDFLLLSGDDFTVLPLLSVGGCGVISVVSNIVPGRMAGMCKAFEQGDMEKARELHYSMMPLARACFFETNPIPVKTAASMMGRMGEELRLPLTPLTDGSRARLTALLKSEGLL